MNVDELLSQKSSLVINDAFVALRRSQVAHYEAAGELVTRQRLTELFGLVVEAIRRRELARWCGTRR